MILKHIKKPQTSNMKLFHNVRKYNSPVDGYNTTEQCFLNCMSESISTEISLMGCQPYGIEQNKTENIWVYYM